MRNRHDDDRWVVYKSRRGRFYASRFRGMTGVEVFCISRTFAFDEARARNEARRAEPASTSRKEES